MVCLVCHNLPKQIFKLSFSKIEMKLGEPLQDVKTVVQKYDIDSITRRRFRVSFSILAMSAFDINNSKEGDRLNNFIFYSQN